MQNLFSKKKFKTLMLKLIILRNARNPWRTWQSKSLVCSLLYPILRITHYLLNERTKALEEEVHCLWAVSRKNNFDLHILESKAQDTEDRLEVDTSQVEKMAEVVTEHWIQIQQLEQALQIAEMRALQAQKQRIMRCTFLKFINGVSGRHLPKMSGALYSYSLGKRTIIKSDMSQALQQLRRFYSAIEKYHNELQGFIKQEMQGNEVAAAFFNIELVLLLASAFITFPILGAWMLVLSWFS
ncbi:uncharacterized protein LOC120123966 [Hibiscus syriacus]|uniref:uncharacterized protein LOC120123966 n=1 Tax=Hibiscus syriacus TaxID=106335 RepID=UPI001923AD3E|nr:uncharacterized protein LOC120123966 [Hibiscus syriacus]